jgi:hypothetical protein
MPKNSQVSIFVIAGICILVVVSIILYLGNSSNMDYNYNARVK